MLKTVIKSTMSRKRSFQQFSSGTKNYNNNNYNNDSRPYYGANPNPMSLVQPHTDSSVRGMPKGLPQGVTSYRKAIETLQTQIRKGGMISTPTTDWIKDFDHFKQLSKIPYKDGHLTNVQSNGIIENYLKSIENDYREINRKSTTELNDKIESYKQSWLKKHKSIPSESELTKDGKKTELYKLYSQELKSIKREHRPIVYAQPGESKFEYLTNTIRLMNLNKTICFAFDIEAYENDNNVVTEIGISIYDPRENINSMVPLMRNFHLIISEALPLRNRNWICDFKDCYLLGESLVLSLSETVIFIQTLINYYMKTSFANENDPEYTWSRAFVGHNIKGDLDWLRKIGVVIPSNDKLDFQLISLKAQAVVPSTTKGKILEKKLLILDTHTFYSACYGTNGSSLGKILRLFQLPHAYLHNAGNDAHYTLRVLMHMCDINFRKQMKLDDLTYMSEKIQQWIDRGNLESKILPMSYAVSVVDATRKAKVQDSRVSKKPSFKKRNSFIKLSLVDYNGLVTPKLPLRRL
ncbi:uncharacterized protein NDAI_0F04420 [Naumovozyma dairenensis CBS 421]|uniref:Gfd2/YDR514C-like C-terminal domain-containing protein n=1 Tax=Naumovozyma dairenensis (strain ATCC 10597 / BCRC 20456 / CBS 421 / NBRC 0211 / NRRL Y-12639) TaxID=1071378 RepID=G0WD99_NAUDC|nr:hypothetical protein NDAI_0F04420 [Naumovozyma dairenensis CBS 421]CCD25760.1 hypothetical protein NDAI_0F04420 [Naumovozyma dairenensis CBS 421]